MNSLATKLFNYNKKNVIKALRFHFLQKLEIKFLILFINLFSLMCAFLFYFKKISSDVFILYTIIWLIVFGSLWYILPYIIWNKEKTFKYTIQILFDNRGITILKDNQKQFLSWDKFIFFKDAQDFYYLHTTKNSFFLISKDAINPDEFIAVKELFYLHLKNK